MSLLEALLSIEDTVSFGTFKDALDKEQVLDLSHTILSLAHIQDVCDALSTNQSIIELNLSNTELNNEAIQLLSTTLEKNAIIKIINISVNDINDEGITKLVPALIQMANLTDLDLSENLLNARSLSLLAPLLNQNGLHRLVLDIDFKDTPEDIAAIGHFLKHNTSLCELSLSSFMNDAAIISLLEALEANPNLKVLDLSKNRMTDSGAKAVADFLRKKPSIAELNLNYSLIADVGAMSLAEVASQHPNLSELHLENQHISDKGALRLAEALEKNPKLRTLKIWVDPEKSKAIQNRINSALAKNKNPDLFMAQVPEPALSILPKTPFNVPLIKEAASEKDPKNEPLSLFEKFKIWIIKLWTHFKNYCMPKKPSDLNLTLLKSDLTVNNEHSPKSTVESIEANSLLSKAPSQDESPKIPHSNTQRKNIPKH